MIFNYYSLPDVHSNDDCADSVLFGGPVNQMTLKEAYHSPTEMSVVGHRRHARAEAKRLEREKRERIAAEKLAAKQAEEEVEQARLELERWWDGMDETEQEEYMLEHPVTKKRKRKTKRQARADKAQAVKNNEWLVELEINWGAQ